MFMKIVLGIYLFTTSCSGYTSHWGTNNYVEHQEGTGYNVIISAPHGGDLEPSGITTRLTAGCNYDSQTETCQFDHNCQAPLDTTNCDAKTTKDAYTKELSIAVADELESLAGSRPHVVINHLHRKKLDANREVNEATFGDSDATTAYNEYFDYIDDAKTDVGTGLLLDMHGQSHSEGWVELGYTVTKSRLNSGDFRCTYSTIEKIVKTNCDSTEPNCDGDCFFDMFREDTSLGTYMVTECANISDSQHSEVEVVPSGTTLSPGSGNYYSGGYIVKNHGSKTSGSIDAIQIESPYWLRTNAERAEYAKCIARAVKSFMDQHY